MTLAASGPAQPVHTVTNEHTHQPRWHTYANRNASLNKHNISHTHTYIHTIGQTILRVRPSNTLLHESLHYKELLIFLISDIVM